ncbi:hypothetical protein EVAR_81589_1 [Eumeta japonica]|uniref:Uncharacterized protein n=1 Tax=Eumeta variegata TaxID=151549 RepID=A0A4C1WF41_EUMVA|nr:hypothetical protein EVAR_81589_1 [Eumeta japonica]
MRAELMKIIVTPSRPTARSEIFTQLQHTGRRRGVCGRRRAAAHSRLINSKQLAPLCTARRKNVCERATAPGDRPRALLPHIKIFCFI